MTTRLLWGAIAIIIAGACYEDDATNPALDRPIAILVAGPRSVAVGDTITLFAAVWDHTGRVASPVITWRSSDPSRATVTGGLDTGAVRGVGAGNAIISAWSDAVGDSVLIAVVAAH